MQAFTSSRSVKKSFPEGVQDGKYSTYRAECDHGPIPSCEIDQLCPNRGELLHVLALPDTIREVRPVRKVFSRFEKM